METKADRTSPERDKEPKRPAHELVFEDFVRVIEPEIQSTGSLPIRVDIGLGLLLDILMRSEVPNSDIPAMVKKLDELREDNYRNELIPPLTRLIDNLNERLSPQS